MLGLWGVAWRIIQIPVSLFAALWRVSFPGMSRLVAAKEDVGSTIERVIALVAIGTGVLVAPLAASASAWIHVLIGAQWANAASAIPPACFAMTFGVPISVALAGYLWAIGSASVPLRATARWHPCDAAASPAAAPRHRRRRSRALRTSRVPWSSLSSSSTQRGGRRPSGSALAWPSPWCSRPCRHRAAGSLRVGSDRIWRGRCRARRLRSASSWAAWRRSTALTSPTPGRSLGADFAEWLRLPTRARNRGTATGDRMTRWRRAILPSQAAEPAPAPLRRLREGRCCSRSTPTRFPRR